MFCMLVFNLKTTTTTSWNYQVNNNSLLPMKISPSNWNADVRQIICMSNGTCLRIKIQLSNVFSALKMLDYIVRSEITWENRFFSDYFENFASMLLAMFLLSSAFSCTRWKRCMKSTHFYMTTMAKGRNLFAAHNTKITMFGHCEHSILLAICLLPVMAVNKWLNNVPLRLAFCYMLFCKKK